MIMIKAAIFDMDGVLVDNAECQMMAWREAVKDFGVRLNMEDYKRVAGMSTTDTIKALLGDKISKEELEKVKERKSVAFWELFEKNFKPVRGAVEFIKELKEDGFKLAVATSAEREKLVRNFERIPIKEHLDVTVTASDVKMAKPSPEIYLKTAEKLGALPSECVVFEDSRSGVAAALSAGMRVVLVMTTHKKGEVRDVSAEINDFTMIEPADIRRLDK
jgi:beta-phosphoglucomutase